MALRAIKAGANGYLNKGRAANDLFFAITKILEGKKFITETVADLLVNEYQREKSDDYLKELSDREYFVLLRLAAGETITEISRSLSLSVKTISTYRTRLMRKLKLKHIVDLINFAKDNNIS